MKKIVILSVVLACVGFFVMLSGCSREKAMEQLMADPQMSQMIMQKIWETPETKGQLVQMVMDDAESMNKLRESLIADSTKAAMMLDLMLANEDFQEMIKEKTTELHARKRR
jgi:flagellar basal body-associated protein FliL